MLFYKLLLHYVKICIFFKGTCVIVWKKLLLFFSPFPDLSQVFSNSKRKAKENVIVLRVFAGYLDINKAKVMHVP